MKECLDDFLRLGKYTILATIVIELLMILESGNIIFMVFAGSPPKIVGCQNMTVTPNDNLCKLYHQGICDPILDYQFYSVNVEFNLLCKDGKKVKDSTSYQMLGYVIGALVFGQISDSFGRKWSLFFCSLLQGIFGIASAFCQNMWTFSLLKAIITFFCTGHIAVSFVYMSESWPKKHRMWMFFVFSWSPNIVVVTLMAWLCGDWRTLSIVLNSLGFVVCGLLLFTHETPHFLVRKGRTEEAERVVKSIYKLDGYDLDETDLERVLEKEREQAEASHGRHYSYQHLFCTWKFARLATTLLFALFATSIVNYGILFNLDEISGSLYFNSALSGGFRCILNIVSAIADISFPWLGRRMSNAIYSGYTLVALIAAMAIQIGGFSVSLATVHQYVLLSACAVVCQIYSIGSLGITEVFPTAIRNVAMAAGAFSEAIATLLSPQLFTLNSVAVWLPLGVLAVVQLIELISYHFWVPETKGMPLADKMPPREEWLGIFGKADRIAAEQDKQKKTIMTKF